MQYELAEHKLLLHFALLFHDFVLLSNIYKKNLLQCSVDLRNSSLHLSISTHLIQTDICVYILNFENKDLNYLYKLTK